MEQNSQQQKPKLIILVGIPGCGKTTYANKFLQKKNTCILSSDSVRKQFFGDANAQFKNKEVFAILFEKAKSKLKQGMNVVIDATNITSAIRKETLAYFSDLDLQKIATVFNAPIEVCISRDKARTRSVGENVVLKLAARFEPPTLEEGFDEINIINT